MEHNQPIKTVGVLIYRNNEVLLVKHGTSASHQTGIYGLPAGKPNENEDDRAAAIRELHEETGLITNPSDLIELPKTYNAKIQRKDGIRIFSLKVFLCKSYKGKLRQTSESSPEWVPFTKLKELPLLPNVELIVTENIE